MDTIKPLTAVPPSGSSTSRSGGRSQGPATAALGQILTATVLDLRGHNRFLLDINGNNLLAESKATLTAGQKLQLQVTQTTPTIELKIIAEQRDNLAGRSLTLLGSNLDISALFQSLTQSSPPALNQLSTVSQQSIEGFFTLQQQTFTEDNTGSLLKSLINRLGLSLEHLLASGKPNDAARTLKAALLEVIHHFKGAEEIAEKTQKVLTTLELYQLAQLRLGDDKLLLLPLPLPFLEQGYLLIEDNRDEGETEKKESSDSPRHFSLHLTLSDIGHIKVEFQPAAEGLFLQISTESQEKADFFAQQEQLLRESLSDIRLLGVTFTADAGDPINQLIQQLVPQGTSIVNTTV